VPPSMPMTKATVRLRVRPCTNVVLCDKCLCCTLCLSPEFVKGCPVAPPLSLNLIHEPEDRLMARAAWLYYVVGLNQEEAAARLGLHRSRVVRLLSEARDRGLVSISIQHEMVRDLRLEQSIADRFGLDFCLATPAIDLDVGTDPALAEAQGLIARRAVGSVAATFLRGQLAVAGDLTVGVSWGRTLEQTAQHVTGLRAPQARFVSLMGSLTRNSASNPFEVVQAFAARTGGQGYFLPVPFIADSEADRDVLMSQRIVGEAMALARSADLHLISVGELTETAVLRRQDMISAEELRSIRAAGAVCDTLGVFFDAAGRTVEHAVARRALAVDFEHLRGRAVVLLAAGVQKATAIAALLRTGVVQGLNIDGDTAQALDRLDPQP
jgi:DNA-binding transcriptional regulator LsrR (DeoR family)